MSQSSLVHKSKFSVHRLKKPANFQLSTLNWRQRRRGFSLIELLVVISIIGVLLATASVSWTNAQQKGRDGRRKADLRAIQQALELYINANGTYPNSSAGNIVCAGSPVVWGTLFQCPASSGPIFMNQLPQDPIYQATTGYHYRSAASGLVFSYTISAELENDNDPDRIPSPLTVPCDPEGTRDYCVTFP